MPLDLGLGLVSGVLAHHVFGISPGWAILLAVTFILLPDLDGVIQVVRRGRLGGMDFQHRDLLHRPLLYVPIGTTLAFLAAGWQIAILFAAMSLAHFLHDSIGTGWGVAWLRPFSRDYFKFFSEDKGDASVTWRKTVVRWTPEQQRAIAAQYGNPNWLRDMYLRPQAPYFRILIIEIAALLAGIGAIWFLYS